MLRGEKVHLRARLRADLEVLHGELREDVDVQMTADSRPYTPESLEAAQARFDKSLTEDPDPRRATFSVVETATGEPVGGASLWGVDEFQRSAHLGMSLLASARGRGLGRDAVRVLCDYGFRIRGLHRLQIETLATNAAALGSALAAGFVEEGRLRASEWVGGRFVDGLVLGLLAEEWEARPGTRP